MGGILRDTAATRLLIGAFIRELPARRHSIGGSRRDIAARSRFHGGFRRDLPAEPRLRASPRCEQTATRREDRGYSADVSTVDAMLPPEDALPGGSLASPRPVGVQQRAIVAFEPRFGRVSCARLGEGRRL